MQKSGKQRATSTHELRRVCGLVAFFDILGFRGLISNNDCELVGNLVRQALHEAPRKIKNHFDKSEFGARVRFIVISDSVIVFQSPRDGLELAKRDMAIPFINFCSVFSAWMFKNGLPVRGAIARGDYCADQTGLVGKPLVEAYELANSLELAACAVCLSAEDWVTKPELDWPEMGHREESAIRGSFCLHKTATKQGMRELYILDNRRLIQKEKPLAYSNVQMLFAAHKKGCGKEVDGKIENTSAFLSQSKVEAP